VVSLQLCTDAANPTGVAAQLQSTVPKLLEELRDLSSTIRDTGSAKELFFFGRQVLIMLQRTMPILQDSSIRKNIQHKLNDLVGNLAHITSIVHNSGQWEDTRHYYFEICGAWMATIEAEVALEHVPAVMKTCFSDKTDKTAGELFKQLDGRTPEDAAFFGNLVSMIDPTLHVLIRVQTLRLMGHISNEKGILFMKLDDLVCVGEDGQAVHDKMAALQDSMTQEILIFSALHALNVSTPVESTAASLCISVQKLLTSLQAATKLMNGSPTPEGCKKHQDMFRHLGFHRCVIDAEGESILSVLAAGADRRDQERLSAYYSTSRQPQAVLSEERELIKSSYDFLTMFCKDNRRNQEVIDADTIDYLFEQYFRAELGEVHLFIALCSGDRAAALRIRKADVVHTTRYIRWAKSATKLPTNYHYILWLQTLVCNDGKPVPENQKLVFQTLMASDAQALDKSFWLKQDKLYLNDRLHSVVIDADILSLEVQMQDHSSRLHYHIGMMHLLAQCAFENSELCAQLRDLLPVGLFIGTSSL
jgi:hypothetical protein